MNDFKYLRMATCCLCLFSVTQCKRGTESVVTVSNIASPVSSMILKSSSPTWKMEMTWEANSLTRKIRFAKGKEKFCEWFDIELEKRRTPFRIVDGSVDFTRMGAYQPGVHVLLNGRTWSVTVCHEKADFASTKALIEYLQLECNKGGVYALNKDGSMVSCGIQDDADGQSFNLEVYTITIDGKSPPESLILPYTAGTISCPSGIEGL